MSTNNIENAAFGGDDKFLSFLKESFNDTDFNLIIDGYSTPYVNNHINRHTGRVRIGIPKTRPRKMLRGKSLHNYKSIIRKFCLFKMKKVGRDAPVSSQVILDYVDNLNAGIKKYQTIATEIRVLNKNIFVPITKQEAGIPKLSSIKGSIRYNNKPQFNHTEIALALYRMWITCKNREHVHKVFLIYYTGLRSEEAGSITFNDILQSYSTSNAIIPIRKGKGNKIRHVILFKGAAMDYYNNFLIPFLAIKMQTLLLTYPNTEQKDHLYKYIFSQSRYHSCRKVFRKCLHWAVIKEYKKKNEDDTDLRPYLKGGGLHSIRADWATRTLKLLSSYTGEFYTPLKLTAQLLGHRETDKIMSHYLNAGSNFTKDYNIQQAIEEYRDLVKESQIIINNNIQDHQKVLYMLFGTLLPGEIANQKLKEREKIHDNMRNLTEIEDTNYLIPTLIPSSDDIPQVSYI